MPTIKKYYIFETIYSFALSFTKSTFVVFFLSHKLSHLEIGLVFGIFNLTVIASEPITAVYSELFGRKKSILLGCFLKVFAALLFFFGNNISTFLIAEIVSGIALTFISGCIKSWAVDEFKREGEKRKLFEIFAHCKKYKNLALIVGGLAGAYLGSISLAIPWAANGFFFLILAIVIQAILPTSERKTERNVLPEFKNIFIGYQVVIKDKCILALIASGFLSSFSLASIKLFWLPTMKDNFQTSVTFLGWLWVGIAGSIFLGSYFVKPYVSKFKYKLDSLITFSFISTICLICMINTLNTWWTIVFYFLFEFGKPLYSTVKSDLMNYQISREGRVTILSFASLVSKLGTTLGLISIGYVSDIWGIQNAWYFSAGLFFANFILYIITHQWMFKIPCKKEVLSVS